MALHRLLYGPSINSREFTSIKIHQETTHLFRCIYKTKIPTLKEYNSLPKRSQISFTWWSLVTFIVRLYMVSFLVSSLKRCCVSLSFHVTTCITRNNQFTVHPSFLQIPNPSCADYRTVNVMIYNLFRSYQHLHAFQALLSLYNFIFMVLISLYYFDIRAGRTVCDQWIQPASNTSASTMANTSGSTCCN